MNSRQSIGDDGYPFEKGGVFKIEMDEMGVSDWAIGVHHSYQEVTVRLSPLDVIDFERGVAW